MVSIAEATIDLHANIARLRADLAKGSAELGKFQTGVTRGFKAMAGALAGLGIGIGIGQLISFGRRIIEAGGQVQDMADQLRVGTEALQALNAASDEAGIGAETLQVGLTRLNESIGEAAGGSKTAIKAFADLGVAFENADGSARDTESVLGDLARAYNEAGDKTKFLADLTDVMGRNAGRLGPIMQAVADGGMQAFIDKQRELGLVASEETIAALDALGDGFDRLGNRIMVVTETAIAEWAKFLGFVDRTQGEIDDLRLKALQEQKGFIEKQLPFAELVGGPRLEDLHQQLAAIEDLIQLEQRAQNISNAPAVAPPATAAIDTSGLVGGGNGGGGRSFRTTAAGGFMDEPAREFLANVAAEDAARFELLRRALEAEAEAADEAAQATEDAGEWLNDLGFELRGLGGVLGDLVTGAIDAKDALGIFLNTLLDFVFGQLSQLQSFGGPGGGLFSGLNLLGSLFGSAAGGVPFMGVPSGFAMAEGGSGMVREPTLFLAGEAGPERFAFGDAASSGNFYQINIAGDGDEAKIERVLRRHFPGIVRATAGEIGARARRGGAYRENWD